MCYRGSCVNSSNFIIPTQNNNSCLSNLCQNKGACTNVGTLYLCECLKGNNFEYITNFYMKLHSYKRFCG